MKKTSFARISGFFRRFYPLPEAFLGYLVGILTAALSVETPIEYDPLPLKDALSSAFTAEIPFYIFSAVLLLFRPMRQAGALLALLKSACCGFGAEHLLFSTRPSVYFCYIGISILQTALYACPIRYAVNRLNERPLSKNTVLDYLLRWLFYSGCALLLFPLKFCACT